MNYTSMTSEVKSRPRILQCAIEALRSLALFGTLHNNPRSLWTSIRVIMESPIGLPCQLSACSGGGEPKK